MHAMAAIGLTHKWQERPVSLTLNRSLPASPMDDLYDLTQYRTSMPPSMIVTLMSQSVYLEFEDDAKCQM